MDCSSAGALVLFDAFAEAAALTAAGIATTPLTAPPRAAALYCSMVSAIFLHTVLMHPALLFTWVYLSYTHQHNCVQLSWQRPVYAKNLFRGYKLRLMINSSHHHLLPQRRVGHHELPRQHFCDRMTYQLLNAIDCFQDRMLQQICAPLDHHDRLQRKSKPLTTPTPTELRRVDIDAMKRQTSFFGSNISAELRPVVPSKPPTA
uniref:Uncharacterized protein n=1 Tax=Glossina pallidipes TaxID=7398 RepID=A0A1A9ZIW2_GLOPL